MRKKKKQNKALEIVELYEDQYYFKRDLLNKYAKKSKEKIDKLK